MNPYRVLLLGSVFAAAGRADRLLLGAVVLALSLAVAYAVALTLAPRFASDALVQLEAMAWAHSVALLVVGFPYVAWCCRTEGVTLRALTVLLWPALRSALLMGLIVFCVRTMLMSLALVSALSLLLLEVGAGVTDLKVGDRVAYAGPAGGYATERLIAADRVVKIPDGIDYKTAAGMMLQGMTVRYLFRDTYKVGPETTMLFHAAAGGVGLIACQWAKALGLQLIGTAGGPAKCVLAKEHGAAHVIDYKSEDFVARVKEITGGKGVKVVYDSIGKDTFDKSLDCLRPFGLLACFGNASGPAAPFSPSILAAKGSLYVTRQTLFTHMSTRESTQAMADDLFDVVTRGAVKIHIGQRFPLERVADAHRALEARQTTGSTILTV